MDKMYQTMQHNLVNVLTLGVNITNYPALGGIQNDEVI